MSKIKPMTIDQTLLLGVDEKNHLYWDNKPVITEEKIKLHWPVNIAIIFGSLSTLALATIEILRYCN